MPEKRPKWSRLNQKEIARQRAQVAAKARHLRAQLRQLERAGAATSASASVNTLREQVDGLAATVQALQFRVHPRRTAADRLSGQFAD